MNSTIYISFAVAPVLVLISFILLKSTRFKAWEHIWNTLILGLISVIFVVLAKYLIDLRWHNDYHGLKRTLFYIVFGLAFTAELFKYIALRIATPKFKAIKSPVDGVIFGVFCVTGFCRRCKCSDCLQDHWTDTFILPVFQRIFLYFSFMLIRSLISFLELPRVILSVQAG